ncbi:unnamed protein product [Discula destructiva]
MAQLLLAIRSRQLPEQHSVPRVVAESALVAPPEQGQAVTGPSSKSAKKKKGKKSKGNNAVDAPSATANDRFANHYGADCNSLEASVQLCRDVGVLSPLPSKT